jgi:hypothetical protein
VITAQADSRNELLVMLAVTIVATVNQHHVSQMAIAVLVTAMTVVTTARQQLTVALQHCIWQKNHLQCDGQPSANRDNNRSPRPGRDNRVLALVTKAVTMHHGRPQ